MSNASLAKAILAATKGIQHEADELWRPPLEAVAPRRELVLLTSVTRGSGSHIEKIVHQVNSTYEVGCFDACAVMIRRLVETLIIEAFEAKQISSVIKTAAGDFKQLSDLVDETLRCSSWNLTRGTKRALPRLKDIGDKSAHSRYYLAHRGDIDKFTADLRLVVQELLHIAGLK